MDVPFLLARPVYTFTLRMFANVFAFAEVFVWRLVGANSA